MKRFLPVFALLAVGLSGCPKRIEFGPEGELTDPAAVLALIEKREATGITVQGDAKIRIDSPQAGGVASLYLAVSRPALVHLETLDFFGKPQAVLVSDGTRFGLYQAQENKFLYGPASAQNISRFLPVVLPPQELVWLTLGQAPRIPHERAELSLDVERGGYLLRLFKGPVEQRLLVHPKLFRVMKSELIGLRAYDVEFDDFDDSPANFPRRMQLTSAAAETTVELRFKDVKVNEPPDLTMFEVAAPEGVPTEEVDAEGRPVTPPVMPPNPPPGTAPPGGQEPAPAAEP